MPSRYFERDAHVFKDEFEIQELIGEGSFAKVYRCQEKQSGKIFAVKEIRLDEGFSFSEAVREEMEIWKDLQHENIVSLHQTFQGNSSVHFVCENVDGGNLFDEILGHSIYSEQQARSFIKQVRFVQSLFNFSVLNS